MKFFLAISNQNLRSHIYWELKKDELFDCQIVETPQQLLTSIQSEDDELILRLRDAIPPTYNPVFESAVDGDKRLRHILSWSLLLLRESLSLLIPVGY